MDFYQSLIIGLQIASGFGAMIGLIITFIAFRRNRGTVETDLAEDIFKDLRMLEKEKYELSNDIKTKKDWASLFFNTLEWFAFLVNEKKIKDKKIKGFFKEAVTNWHDEIFLDADYIDEDQVTDDNEYPEFKKLYKEFMKGKN
jgi:hypothetical protein